MKLLKIKSFLTITTLLLSSFSLNYLNRSNALEIARVKGNCEPFNCQLLLKDLAKNWDWKIEEWLNTYDCKDRKTLGLNVWQKPEKNRVVSVTCWGDTENPKEIFGHYLGILPFPGEEKSFTSQWICKNDQNCQNYIKYLRLNNRNKVTEIEVKCAIKNGQLTIVETSDKINIKCLYLEYATQIDINLDGIADNETEKSTNVDEIMLEIDRL